MVAKIQLPVSIPTNKKLVRDPLLSGGDNVKFLLDFYHPFSLAKNIANGTPIPNSPANGTPVYDIAEQGDGEFSINGGTLFYSDSARSLSFDSMTNEPGCILAPASVSADVWSAGQNFLLCAYFTMPSQSDFNGGTQDIAARPFIGAQQGNHVSNNDIVSIYQDASGTPGPSASQFLAFRRPVDTGGAVAEVENHNVAGAGVFSGLCQIAFWRNAAGTGFRVKTATSELLGNYARGDDNVDNFSSLRFFFGVNDYWDLTNAQQASMSNFSLHRAFIETLPVGSARDPETVLDNDWQYFNEQRP